MTYVAMYPDPIGRQQAVANYGTNGDTALSRPAMIPVSSDTVLVSSSFFGADGFLAETIDPAGTAVLFTYDHAGRLVKKIENARAVIGSSSSSSSSSGGGLPTCDDTNVTTQWTYAPDGGVATLTALNVATGDQTTGYNYGTTLAASDVARSDLKASVVYPDGGTVVYLSNRQGQVKQFIDQRSVIHAYDFDLLGRLVQDRVTSLGGSSSSSSSSSSGGGAAAVDGSIQRIGRTFEVRGMLAGVTSYSSPVVGHGSVVNDVLRQYNAFGQLVAEYYSGT